MRSKCLEGTVKSHAEDCSRYWQCLNGETLIQSCPTQSYFDPAWEVCVIDVSGRCVAAAAQCAEGQIEVIPGNNCGYFRCVNGSLEETKCQLGSYFNESLKLCEIDENRICNTENESCTEGFVQADPMNCAGYLRCVDGSLVEEQCTIGSYFNADFKICEIDEKGNCIPMERKCREGSIEEDPEDCGGYLRCVDGRLVEEKCAKGSSFNAELKICQIDENGICIPKSERCTEGSLKEDPEDCAGYLKCVDGILVKGKCAKGSFFNADLKICETDENGICDPKQCSEGSIQADPKDCSGYLMCVDGNLIEKKCAKGSFFNAYLKICEIDENGNCDPNNDKCTEGSLEADPKDCSGYLICVDGNLIEEKCAKGSFFNAALKICEMDENGVCIRSLERCFENELGEIPENRCGYLRCTYGNLIQFDCSNGRYYNSSLEACVIDENGLCAGLKECDNSETRIDPDDCAGYLQCIDGKMVKRLCSYGSYFHTALHSCVVDDEGVCVPLWDHCKEGEREADPEDFASYLECIDGDFMPQRCESGSYFNADIKSCIVDVLGRAA